MTQHQVAELLVVPASTTLYSAAIPMNGDNTLTAYATLISTSTQFGSADQLKISIERSNDLSNWYPDTADIIKFGTGSEAPSTKDFAPGGGTFFDAPFIRFKFLNVHASVNAILSAWVTTKKR